MNTLSTVNVLEMVKEVPQQVKSFPDTPEGNKEAEEFFTKVAKENRCPDEEVAVCIEDGWFNRNDYFLYLLHSS